MENKNYSQKNETTVFSLLNKAHSESAYYNGNRLPFPSNELRKSYSSFTGRDAFCGIYNTFCINLFEKNDLLNFLRSITFDFYAEGVNN